MILHGLLLHHSIRNYGKILLKILKYLNLLIRLLSNSWEKKLDTEANTDFWAVFCSFSDLLGFVRVIPMAVSSYWFLWVITLHLKITCRALGRRCHVYNYSTNQISTQKYSQSFHLMRCWEGILMVFSYLLRCLKIQLYYFSNYKSCIC